MARSSLPYELSRKADYDLEDIFNYTEYKFGFKQAVAYLTEIDEVFDLLSNEPQLGRERNEIRAGLRSIAKESHAIFYRILNGRTPKVFF